MMKNWENSKDSVVAFVVAYHGRAGTQPPHDRVSCTHCGKLGHEESNCFEVIGYPGGWGTRGRGRGEEAVALVEEGLQLMEHDARLRTLS